MLNISYGLKESKKIIYYMSEMIQPVWNIIQKERIRLYKISNYFEWFRKYNMSNEIIESE